MEEISDTSIKIPLKLREKLNSIKVHPRETYSDIIERLLKEVKK